MGDTRNSKVKWRDGGQKPLLSDSKALFDKKSSHSPESLTTANEVKNFSSTIQNNLRRIAASFAESTDRGRWIERENGRILPSKYERGPSQTISQYLSSVSDTQATERITNGELGEEGDSENHRYASQSGDTSSTPTTQPSSSPKERLVGIPAYNESIAIGSTVLMAKEFASEVVVVDDGSTDGTSEIARRAGATVFIHDTNRGKGRALQTFFSYARSTEYDSFVVLDGDGQHNPGDVPAVVKPVEEDEADIVIGSRYLDASHPDETPIYRRFGQQILDALTVGASGRKLSDTQSGFRAFSREAIDRLTIRTDGMGVESEMITSAIENDLHIEETPITVRYRGVKGQTYNPIRHGMEVVKSLAQLVRDRRPLLYFGMPGLIFALVGVILATNTILLYNDSGVFLIGHVFFGTLFTVIGLLGIFCGLLLSHLSAMIEEREGG